VARATAVEGASENDGLPFLTALHPISALDAIPY